MKRPLPALMLKLIFVVPVPLLVALYWLSFQGGGHTAAAEDQLLTNPGFETLIEGVPQGWTAAEGTTFVSSTLAHGGSYGAILQSSSVGPKSIYQVVPISAGAHYTMSGYILKNDQNVERVVLRMSWFSSAGGRGTRILDSDSPTLMADSPSFVLLSTTSIAAPPGAKSVSVMVVLYPVSDTPASIYVDDLRLVGDIALPATVVSSPSSTATPTPSATPPAASAAFLGHVQLQGRGGAPNERWVVPLTVSLRPLEASAPTLQFDPVTDASGRFTVTGFAAGIYEVAVKTARSLAEKRSGMDLIACDPGGYGEPCPSLDFGMLPEGDADGDGFIDSRDYALLAASYLETGGRPGFDPRVDFNEDGRVNSSDYAVLAVNYFRTSDGPASRLAIRAVNARVVEAPRPAAHPLATASPSLTPTLPATPTASPSPTSTTTPPPVSVREILISEVQYDPSPSGVDSDFEWFELFNATDRDISLAWLKISDNVATADLPGFTLAPRQHVVVAATSDFLSLFPGFSGPIVYLQSGRIGNGLSNTGDRLVLQDWRGQVVDAMSYGSDRNVFDPPCPTVAAGQSLERRGDDDTDTAADFATNTSPSPGRGPLPSPTATATVTPSPSPSPGAYAAGIWLNEVLPAPKDVDWNGDGTTNSDDEWIELYNERENEASIGGWQLGDASSRRFTIPQDMKVPPRGFKVFYGKETGLALNNDGDSVKLFRPDVLQVDAVEYGAMSYNASFARISDGHGEWRKTSSPSLGATNAAPASLSPPSGGDGATGQSPLDQVKDRLVTIAYARSVRTGEKVYLLAQVIAPPNLLGSRRAYILDETGALAVYLQRGSYPPLQVGDWALFTGTMGERRGEKEIIVYWVYDAVFLERKPPPTPIPVGLDQVSESWESKLVQVTGIVEGKTATSLELGGDEGSARVYVRDVTGIDLRSLAKGMMLSVTGIVSQYDSQPPYDAGFRLLPRSPGDIAVLDLPAEIAVNQAAGGIPTPTAAAISVRPVRLPSAGGSPLPPFLLAGTFLVFAGLALRLALPDH